VGTKIKLSSLGIRVLTVYSLFNEGQRLIGEKNMKGMEGLEISRRHPCFSEQIALCGSQLKEKRNEMAGSVPRYGDGIAC